MNQETMNQETKKTDQLIKIYKEDPVKENLHALVHQVRRTIFLIPALMPDNTDMEEFKKTAEEHKGEQMKLPEGIRPIPCMIRNKDGESFVPIYTSQEHIPAEPKYHVLMNMPFRGCYGLALNSKSGAKGIAINPFTDNLMFGNDLLGAVQKEEDELLKANQKKVQVTPEQFKVMMRQKVEFHDLPLRVYKEGEPFVNELCDKKETLVNEVFQSVFQDPKLYPFGESDYAVMALNIRPDLLLVRIDLPEAKAQAQLCHRIYITNDPESKSLHYFTIEKGREKDQRNFCGVDSEGKHVDYGEAPVEGAEIQRIMDHLDSENDLTS